VSKAHGHPVAVSAGLTLAGLTALVVASWVLAPDLADVGSTLGWIQAGTIVIAVGVVGVFATRHGSLSPLVWCVAAAGLALTVLAVAGFVAQYQSGFPGQRTLLAVVGGLAVIVGAVVIAVVPPGRWRRLCL
jgi:hypothetical protein